MPTSGLLAMFSEVPQLFLFVIGFFLHWACTELLVSWFRCFRSFATASRAYGLFTLGIGRLATSIIVRHRILQERKLFMAQAMILLIRDRFTPSTTWRVVVLITAWFHSTSASLPMSRWFTANYKYNNETFVMWQISYKLWNIFIHEANKLSFFQIYIWRSDWYWPQLQPPRQAIHSGINWIANLAELPFLCQFWWFQHIQRHGSPIFL